MNKMLRFVTLLVIGLAVTLSSCSSDEMYDYVSADNFMVLSLSPEKILKNAGFELTSDGITPPRAFDRLTNGSKEVSTLLKCRGIDPKKALVMFDSSAKNPSSVCVIARVSDESSLKTYIKENDLEERGSANGYTVYEIDSFTSLLIKDGLLFITSASPDDAAEYVDSLKTNAAEKPLTSWQIDILDDGDAACGIISLEKVSAVYQQSMPMMNVGQLYNLFYDEDISNGFSIFSIDLDGNKLKSEGKMVNADGKKVEINKNIPTIDPSILKYASANDQLTVVASFFSGVDWSKTPFANIPNGNEVIDYLKSINGTILFSGAVDNTQQLSEISGWHATIAVQLTDGMAQKYAEQITQLLQDKMNVTTQGDMTVFSERGMPTFYLLADGNNLVISSGAPVKTDDSLIAKGKDLKDEYLACSLKLQANSPATTLVALPFGVDFVSKADKDDSEAKAELTGSDKPFLQQLVEFAASM